MGESGAGIQRLPSGATRTACGESTLITREYCELLTTLIRQAGRDPGPTDIPWLPGAVPILD